MDLATVEQGVRQKVHRPYLVRCSGWSAILTQLRGALALGPFIADLQAFFDVETIDALGVHTPPLASQQHMNAPI